MKDKKPFRLIAIGFLSGIVTSGMVFLVINSLYDHQNQKNILPTTPAIAIELLPSNEITVDGKMDINRATLYQLVTLPGIGEAKANAIISFREKYGNFEDIYELTYVAGIGNTLLKSLEDLVIIN